MTIDVNGTTIDVLTHYGTVSTEQVKQAGLLVTAGQDWCPHHKLWTKHKPDECKKKYNNESDEKLKPTALTALVHTEWSDDE